MCSSILAAIGGVLTATLVCELACRALGLTPFQPSDYVIVDVEPGPLLVRHPTLGWANAGGLRQVTYNSGFEYSATHTPRGERVTRSPLTEPLYTGLPRLEIYGCSFTYGWSVADDATYPWRVQAALPKRDVVNLGVGGYGTLHMWLRLKERLSGGSKPHVVVVTYGDLHDERNTLSRAFRKGIVAFANQTRGFSAPRARLRGGELEVDYVPLAYERPPGIQRFALANVAETAYNLHEGRTLRSHEVSRWLLRDMARLCRERGVPLVVAGVTPGAATRELLARLAEEGVRTVDISVDLSLAENNLQPVDWHPSPLAHERFAARLLAYLRAEELV
jgi:hypothetical protein